MFCIVFHQSQLSFIAGIFVVILFAIVMCILTFKQICCIVFECSDFNTLLVFAAQHQLTSIMFCRFCGETVSPEDKFCAKCGGQLEIHRDTGRMFQLLVLNTTVRPVKSHSGTRVPNILAGPPNIFTRPIWGENF